MILAVLNQKGGVGKTTVTFHVAKMSALERDTLAIDLDPQGNLTSCFLKSLPEISNVRRLWDKDNAEMKTGKLTPAPVEERLSIIGTDLSLSYFESGAGVQGYFRLLNHMKEIPQGDWWSVIDCPPNLGLFSVNAMLAADYCLIPVDASRFTMQGLGSLFASIREVNKNLRPDRPLGVLGIILSNANTRTTFVRELQQALRDQYGKWVMDTVLPPSVRVRESMEEGEIVNEGPAMLAYQEMYREIKRRLPHD